MGHDARPFLGVGSADGGGGRGIVLGPATNVFTAATRAAAATARDAYATANATWLAAYDADRSLAIVLSWPVTPVSGTYQVREAGAWLDISGLTVQVGALAPGNDALDELRYRGGAWKPISPFNWGYTAFTREGTFASIEALFNDTRALDDGAGASASGILSWMDDRFNGAVSASNKAGYPLSMDAAWPLGEDAPYFWVLCPEFYEWLPDLTARFYTEGGTPQGFDQRLNDIVLVTQSYKMSVSGIPYDVGQVQCPLVRPADDFYMLGTVRYDPPPPVTRVVTMI